MGGKFAEFVGETHRRQWSFESRAAHDLMSIALFHANSLYIYLTLTLILSVLFQHLANYENYLLPSER